MKKIAFFSIIALLLSLVVTGCNPRKEQTTDGEVNSSDEQNRGDEQSPDGEETGEEVRYTVSAEEWERFAREYNYTVENIKPGEDSHFQRYTEDVIEIGGYIVIFVDDKQYGLEEGANGWVAYDCTIANYWHGGLLEEAKFSDYFYDESARAYVNCDFEEKGTRVEIKFENGLPVCSTTALVGAENEYLSKLIFTNIGNTVINVPDFTFFYDLEADDAKLVTEEIWNGFVNEKNFAAELVAFVGDEYYEYIYKSADSAMELDGEIIVFDCGKKYSLNEIEGVFYAEEYVETALPECFVPECLSPAGLNFNDFEYDNQTELYIQKNTDGVDVVYSFGFENGVLVYVQIERALDPTGSYYTEACGLMITEIGTVVIDVPEYVIAE